jgi:hypothetical protein
MRGARGLAVPLTVWALSIGALLLACVAAGRSPWAASTWTGGDSGFYLQIAQGGYSYFECPPHHCGNAGWMPAYGWLIGLFHLAGLPLVATAVALSWFFHAALLVLLWLTFLDRRLTPITLVVLVYAAIGPGFPYQVSVFPLSMFVFFVVLHLWFLWRERWWGAGAAAFVAVLSYPPGVAIPITAAVWILLQRVSLRERVRRIAIVSGLAVAGLVAFAVDQQLETGHWDAYLLVQEKYHHGLQSPILLFRQSLHVLVHHPPFTLGTSVATETVLFTIVLVCALVAVALRRPLDRVDLMVAIWVVITWLVTEGESHTQVYRIEAALLPLAILVRRLPLALAAVLTVLVLVSSVQLAQVFFENGLV